MTAAIVAVAESDLGVTGKSIYELQTQAARAALAEVGLTFRDIDGLATTGVQRFSASSMSEYWGIQPSWVSSTMEGGSSFELFVGAAADAIEAGHCETVLISYGSNQRSARSRRLGGVVEHHTPESQWEAPHGVLMPISLYAMAAQRHFHEFGTTSEDLAEIAMAARDWALLNPKAYRYGTGPLTLDEYLASPLVSSPLRAADCCLVLDGGAAVIVTSLERARDLTDKPIPILGTGQATTHISMSQMPDLTLTGAAASGKRAFARAGLTPADIDVAEIYDSFTITVLLTLEALGFCGRGEGADFIKNGRIRPGGEFPLNTNGGGLSYCHPGMYGLLLIVEAVRQLRGEAGLRQVPNAEVALVHGTGGVFSNHSTVILGVDR
jgi:acetyl-CoA acetyltransferase